MVRHCCRGIVLLAISITPAVSNWNDTSTGIDLDKLRHFPLVKVRSGWLKAGSRVIFDGITATAPTTYREVVLRGKGKSGKRWEAHIFGLDEVWRADLDGNGTQDYVLFGVGPYFNGRTTPLFSFSILLMDTDGLPVPFFTVLYKGENGEGIKHLVDVNHDGRAELLISAYDENPSDAYVGPFCSGHWITQLYRFQNLGAEEVRGTFGGVRFPFVHDWTYRDTECRAEKQPISSVQPATPFDIGKGPRGAVTTRIRKSTDDSGLLAIDPVAGCNAIRPTTVVYDRSQIREIGFPSQFGNYMTDLANTIRRDGARVELRGINKSMGNGECSVELMWAKQPL